MSQAEELLNSATEENSGLSEGNLGVMLLGSAAPTVEEEHIIIDSDRFIKVPESLKRIAVQYDHDVETVTFDCPRYWDGHDLSAMKVYINYMCPDNTVGCYLTSGVTIDDPDKTVMHFDWVISQNVTQAKGRLSFLVCIKSVDDDGTEKNHWNSELNQEMYISEGLECSNTVVDLNPDIIAALLARTDYVESLVKPEVLAGYINYYLHNNPDVVYSALSGVITADRLREYVDMYLQENPLLIDESLSMSGWAADAEETGKRIRAVADMCLVDETLTESHRPADAATTGDAIDAVSDKIDKVRDGFSHYVSEIEHNTTRIETLEADAGDVACRVDELTSEFQSSGWKSFWMVPYTYDTDKDPYQFRDSDNASTRFRHVYFDLPESVDLSKHLYKFIVEIYGLQIHGYSGTGSDTYAATVHLVNKGEYSAQDSVKLCALYPTVNNQDGDCLAEPKYGCYTTEIMHNMTMHYLTNGQIKGNSYSLRSDWSIIPIDVDNLIFPKVCLRMYMEKYDDGSFMPIETFGIRFSYCKTENKV